MSGRLARPAPGAVFTVNEMPNGEPLPPAVNGDGRDPTNGRFLPSNRFGTGNPTLRKVAQLRQALLEAVSAEDITAVAGKLLTMAKDGDLAAIKELLDRCLGKPPQAVALTDADGESLGVSLAALQTGILDALAGHPEARLAVAAKLRTLAHEPAA